jgi:hypothetical protein
VSSGGNGSPCAQTAPSFEEFLLPDGHGLLEGVDEPAAGVEGGGAVRGGDGNDDGGFADVEAAEAMDDGEIADGVVGEGLSGEAVHLREGHFFIGLVEKMEGAAATAVVADDAIEEDDGSVFAALEEAGNGGWIDGVVGERNVGGWSLRSRVLRGLRFW